MLKNSATELRRLMKERETIFTVGIGDALTAKIASRTPGIDAILTSGFSISAQMFGLPDAELYTRTDNVFAVKNICDVATIPVIADIDTGYGNAVTVIRSVQEFEKAGAAGVIMEDQISPKRCPICVTDTNSLISAEEAAGKIRAAVENKMNDDTVVIARTDATSWDELMRRSRMYIEAGADAIQAISRAYKDKEGLKRFISEVNHPVSLIIVGKLEALTYEDIQEVKPKFAQFALLPVNVASMAIQEALAYLGERKTVVGMPTKSIRHEDLVKLLGMQEVTQMELKYIPKTE